MVLQKKCGFAKKPLVSDGKVHVWHLKQQLNPKYTLKTVKHGGDNIMVWSAFSWHGVELVTKIDIR